MILHYRSPPLLSLWLHPSAEGQVFSVDLSICTAVPDVPFQLLILALWWSGAAGLNSSLRPSVTGGHGFMVSGQVLYLWWWTQALMFPYNWTFTEFLHHTRVFIYGLILAIF